MSIEKVVAALNAAFAADPCAIHALIVNRVPCNQALADDPFVQVDCPPVLLEGLFQVGAIGLVNGVLAAIGLPLAATMFSDEKDDDGRSKLLGFTVYKPSQSEVTEIKSAQPEPEQYWQHKTSGDRVYFVGRTPDGEMVFQCEGDGVETGDLDWSDWEHLPGCDSWAWKPKPVSSACDSQSYEYWSTSDSSRFAYLRVDASDKASLINHDGTVHQTFPWNEVEKRGRLQITKEQAEELEIHKPKPVVAEPAVQYPQWYVPVNPTIADEHNVRIAYLRRDSAMTGETFLVNGASFEFCSNGFRPDELYVVTEDEAKSHVNLPVVKAPSDVMGQSPDDWVPQDRVPRRMVDEYRWVTKDGTQQGWWKTISCHNSISHGHIDIYGNRLEVRCRRKDLPVDCPPVVPDRIPLRLWVKRELIGMHMAVPIVARRDYAGDDMAEVFSDGNGGLFIERSGNAGN